MRRTERKKGGKKERGRKKEEGEKEQKENAINTISYEKKL